MCNKPTAEVTSQAANRYVYVITRRDLPQPHQQVQIAHAAIASTRAYGEPDRTHPHLVVCTVADERELESEFNRLKQVGLPVVEWREEDLGKSATAIATGPIQGNRQRKHLKHLPLLK